MFRQVTAGAGYILGAFHLWLFARQAWAGELAKPEALVKWLGAALLVAALFALSRQGASLFRGRRAVSIWLLVALLHAPAVGARLEALEIPALPQVTVTLSQLITAALAGGALLLFWLLRARADAALARVTSLVDRVARPSCTVRVFPPFAPRPPPSA
jgi:hypothetical protein